MEQLNNDASNAPVAEKAISTMDKVNHYTTVAAVAVTPLLIASTAMAADEGATLNVGTLALSGLSVAAATVFAIKATPKLLLWGYGQILGFIRR